MLLATRSATSEGPLGVPLPVAVFAAACGLADLGASRGGITLKSVDGSE